MSALRMGILILAVRPQLGSALRRNGGTGLGWLRKDLVLPHGPER